MSRVYLDWNATTPLRAEAKAAMIGAMELVGNPSSVHAEGRAAKGMIERARKDLAAALGGGRGGYHLYLFCNRGCSAGFGGAASVLRRDRA